MRNNLPIFQKRELIWLWFLIGTVLMSLITEGGAKAAVCYNSKNVADNVNYDITQNLLASNNQAGYEFNIAKNQGAYIGVYARCPSGVTVNYTYRSYVSPHKIVETEGSYQYVKLNDYLDAAISIKDSSAGVFYPPANYVHMGTDENVPLNKDFQVQDSDLDFHFKLTRPFVGNVDYNLTPAFYVYVTTTDTDPLNNVVYTISYSGKMIVPQSCELNAGQIITMDFGDIGASAFSQAGAGKRPTGVNPITRSVGIKCSNMDAQASLSLRIEANKVSGNAIVSDNPDLGFVLADGKQNPLTPNTIDSKIPFKLDDSGSAAVPISAWPVSVTGNKPVEGKFTSEGYLRVDFD